MDNKKNPLGDEQPKMPKFNMNWLYTLIIITLALLFFTDGGKMMFGEPSATQEATFSKFQTYVQKGYAKNVVVDKDKSELRMYVKPAHVRDVFGKIAQQVGDRKSVV